MLDLFSDAAEGILDLIGEDAFLAGALTPIQINVEHGVQLTGIGGDQAQYKGDLVANRDVATIHTRHNPQSGQTFVQGGATYRLEFMVEDNGATKRFVIMLVT
jgi:hypothetical protein